MLSSSRGQFGPWWSASQASAPKQTHLFPHAQKGHVEQLLSVRVAVIAETSTRGSCTRQTRFHERARIAQHVPHEDEVPLVVPETSLISRQRPFVKRISARQFLADPSLTPKEKTKQLRRRHRRSIARDCSWWEQSVCPRKLLGRFRSSQYFAIATCRCM